MRLPPDQRFTCAQCGRCCRRATVPVSLGEADAYRQAGAERWFSDGGDPFAPIPERPSLLQIRKRADGACGFLSDAGLCRIHEQLGYDRKPLTCRVFPLRFHPVEYRGEGAPGPEEVVVVTTSFACPTIIANEGTPLSEQSREISTLWLAWKEAQPETPASVEFVAGHTMPPAMLPKLRSVLTRILDTPAPDGSFDLAVSLRRIAAFVDDLSRRQVLRLSDEDFSQYFDVMSRHALSHEKVPPPRPPSRLTRLLFRGFLLAVQSVQLHLNPALRGRPWAIRLALVRAAVRLHVGPIGNASFDPHDDEIREIATHYLRTSFSTLGTGRRPIVDEMAMIVAHLNAACAVAVDRESFVQGLLESADLAQADAGGLFSRLLTTLSGGLDAVTLFSYP